ncbi:MAG: FAD-dependent oxidoreductase [Pseudonocardia sp.]|jgi:glycine/D-amino acid oxidase-like deaminating enzyme/nitrite reductase/ring-hydroxylating ferredoxin subunit
MAPRTTATTTEAQSLWLDEPSTPLYPPPKTERSFDVLVLGAGITGLTAALLLKRQGRRVGVVEADRVGSGATGNNTAKVTALQSTMISTIRKVRGAEVAAAYARGSLAAVEQVAALVAEENLDCDLRRRDAFTVAVDAGQLSTIEREHAAAERAGLPVHLTDQVDLPYPVAGAVTLPDQLALHPARYARGLAAAVDGDGCRVFERTRATAVSERRGPVTIDTDRGPLTADHVVVATHYPVWDRGLYFAQMQTMRAYCVAGRVRDRPALGMSITTGDPSWSYQSTGELMIVSGQSHPTGARGIDPRRYTELEDHLRQHWDVEEITHRWSAQDALPYDHTPMIGRYSPVSRRMFVAAGFSKWGLTGGTLAATLLAATIDGDTSSGPFSPQRFTVRGVHRLAQAQAKVTTDIVGDRLLPGQASTTAEIPRGEARVIRSGTDRTGVYRDGDGGLHGVSMRCTHLGCLVRFNAAETSWDCPCHGSRFDVDGEVLEGPAVNPLPRRQPPGT